MRKAGWRPPGMRLRTLLLIGFLLGSLSSCQVVRVERLPPLRNLAPNPGFEEEAGGIPQDWRRILLPGGGPPGPSRTQGWLSPHALYLAPRARVEWRAQVDGVRPGRHYQLTFLVKREGWRDGEYPHLQIFGREIRLNELFSWGGWRKVRHVFRASGEESTELAFIGRGLTHGFAIDDVELLEIAFQELRPSRGEEVQGGRPVFSWTLPPNELIIRQEIEFSRDPGLRSPTVIELMSPQGSQVRLLQPLAGGDWHWRVKAFLGQEEVARSEVQRFLVSGKEGSPAGALPPRVRLDPPPAHPAFFPLGFFSARPDPASLKEVREAGFNTVQGSADPEFVKAAARHGLHAILAVETYDEGRIQSFVRSDPALPGLLAWYLADEPEGRGVSPAALWLRGAALRRLAPYHPTSLTLMRSGQAPYYAPAADIVLVDPYPIPTQPLTWLSDSIDEVRRALRPGQSVWAILQAFSWGGEPLYPKDRPSRYPTFEEQRAMAYLAVTHGASGIFFFGENYARMDSFHWANLKKLGRELSCLLPLLGSSAGGPRFVQPDPAADPKGKPAIHYGEKHLAEDAPASPPCPALERGRYLIAVNPWPRPHPLRLAGFAPGEKRAVGLLGDHTRPIVDGELRDRLGPLGVRIWRLVQEN